MNKALIALGAVLLVVSVIAITYTTTVVNPEPPCGYPPCYPALQLPTTINPYASDGILLAVISLTMMVIGYFIRPHEALDGATPADRAGIKVEGENKWETIIQNVTQKQREKALDGDTN